MGDTEARLRAIQLLINAMQRYKDLIYQKCKSFDNEEEHMKAIEAGEFDALINVDRIRQLATTCRTLEEFAEAIENEQLALDSFNELGVEDKIMKLFGSNECKYLREDCQDDISCRMMGEEIGVELFLVRIRKEQSHLDKLVEAGRKDEITERLASDVFEDRYLRRYYPDYVPCVGKEIGVEPFVVTIGDGFNESEKPGLYMALQDSNFAYSYTVASSNALARQYSYPECNNEYLDIIEDCAVYGRKVLEGITLKIERDKNEMSMQGKPVNERGE